jgi:hypothetical protein
MKHTSLFRRHLARDFKAPDLKPAKNAQRSFPIVVQQDPQLSERIDAARARAGFDHALALQLNIVPGLNFFWD